MVLKTWRPTGIFFALAAPLLYGLGIPLNKLLLAQVNPLFLLALLQLGGGLGVAIIYLLRQRWQPEQVRAQLQGQDWLWLGLSGSMGGVVASLLMMVGLNYTPGTTAALLANLEGVFTVLLAWVVFKDVFSWRVLWGMAAISLGGVVLAL